MSTKLAKKLLLVALFFGFFNAPGQSPGNVSSNLRVWLRADEDVYESNGTTAEANDRVTRWDDQSTVSNDARNTGTTTSRPFYREDIINGHPALEFDSDQFLQLDAAPGVGNTEDFIIFMVFKQNSFVNGQLNDGAGTFIIDRVTETENLASFKIVAGNKYAYQRRLNDGSQLGGPVSATSVNTEKFVIVAYYRDHQGGTAQEGIYINGVLDVSHSGPTGNMSVPRLQIGRHAVNANQGLDGYFAEFALYRGNIMNNTSRRQIESYLAVKYGITLDPSVNYVSPGGSIIYPSTSTHAAYVHDIAGIGRYDNSALNQRTSRSQNAGSMITVSNPSDLDNDEWLLWGHNNGSIEAINSTDAPAGVDRRLGRVWRVAETGGDGNVGTISITVDLADVPGNKNAADLRLLVDSDDVFATGPTQYTVSSSSGTSFTFNNVSINAGNYFTFATVNETTTPLLPVELTSFEVTYEPPIVVATWETASQTNNDFFTLERAGEDLNFFEFVRHPGAGTTKEPRTYTVVDENPIPGRSYYRLKQTDFDGNWTYLGIRRMDIDETGRELVFHPNPSDGRNLHFSIPNTVFHLQEVEVINSQGIAFERQIVGGTSASEYSLQLHKTLPSGFYLIKAKYNGKWKAFRVVVE